MKPGEAVCNIRIDVEGMRQNLHSMLLLHQGQLTEQMQAAVDEALNVERIDAMLRNEARRLVDEALKQEVGNFFRYGKGRLALRDVVNSYLDERYQDFPEVGNAE